jgi:hypothetical protein
MANLAKLAGRSGRLNGRLPRSSGRRGRDHYMLGRDYFGFFSVDQGFAPPAEIYRVEHRRLVDWATFPSWARPQDPDAFEGCCHEG